MKTLRIEKDYYTILRDGKAWIRISKCNSLEVVMRRFEIKEVE